MYIYEKKQNSIHGESLQIKHCRLFVKNNLLSTIPQRITSRLILIFKNLYLWNLYTLEK